MESDDLDPDALLPLDAFAKNASLSIAFVRLLVACGCPTTDGKLCLQHYVDWLPENYHLVRQAAGLAPLPPPVAITKEAEARLKVHGYLRTVMDFTASRISDPEMKAAYAQLASEMDLRLDAEELTE